MKQIIICLVFLCLIGACHNDRSGSVSEDAPLSAPGTVPDIVAPQGASGWATKMKGFNIPCWYSGCLVDEGVDASLGALVSTGADWVAVVPTWYQNDARASAIAADSQKTVTDDEIRQFVANARAKGLKILLKPHIDLYSGQWRGDILPTALYAWQLSYKNFILHYAALADELGIEVLSIGTELKRMSSTEAFWNGLIPDIRAAYSGNLTYSANWDEYDKIELWDSLDFIGIDFYFPIARTATAARADMVSELNSIALDIAEYAGSLGKKVILTELGYRSVDGAAVRPWDYGFSAAEDLTEQADAYSAALEAYEDADWLKGVFWWRWDTRLESDDEGYTIYGKPAADALTQVWRAANSGGGTVPPGGESVSFVIFGDWGSRGSADQMSVALAIQNFCAQNPCDFIFTLGDNFYDDGVSSVTDSHWQESYRDVYGDLGLDFYAVPGNHDMRGSIEAQIDYSNIDPSWHMPAEEYSVCWPEGSDQCLVEIFAFNSCRERFVDEGAPRDAARGFLTTSLAESMATWKLLADHHPIINNGNHGDWDQGDEALEFLTNLYCSNDVDFILSGHAHSFSYLVDTVDGCLIDQLIVGTGGRSLRGVNTDDPRVLATGSFYGFGWIQITPTTFTFEMIDTNGEVFYRVQTEK